MSEKSLGMNILDIICLELKCPVSHLQKEVPKHENGLPDPSKMGTRIFGPTEGQAYATDKGRNYCSTICSRLGQTDAISAI